MRVCHCVCVFAACVCFRVRVQIQKAGGDWEFDSATLTWVKTVFPSRLPTGRQEVRVRSHTSPLCVFACVCVRVTECDSVCVLECV